MPILFWEVGLGPGGVLPDSAGTAELGRAQDPAEEMRSQQLCGGSQADSVSPGAGGT